MSAFSISAVIIFCSVTILYFVAQAKRDNSIVDIFWGVGFCLVAVGVFLVKGESTPRQWLLLSLILIWGVRLAWHIGSRNRGRGEDFRYAAWRKEWGNTQWWRSYLQVFLLQGAIMWIISIPIVLVMSQPNVPLNVLDLAGGLLWVFGFYFEAVADRQLARFKADPANKGRMIQTGLWALSRHPNYFGEITMWWGIFLISLNMSGWYWAMLSPVLLTFLIARVSGVPLLERKYRTHPDFAAYAEKVPELVPRFWWK